MSSESAGHAEEQLTLRAHLDELAQVWPWIERLGARHTISENVQFGIHVCLEEALSNVIRHGYGGMSEKTLTVRFLKPEADYLLFVIDDTAPHFDPLNQAELPAITPDMEMRVGGQGIRMLREFADRLEYEQTADGNRLTIGFRASG